MCIFCDIVNKKSDAYIVYENENVIAFLDNDPINEGHILLIPKKHYLDVDDIPSDLLTEIMEVSKMLVKAIKQVYKPNGYSVMQNGGIFNDVGHYHMHIFPRYYNDGFEFKYSNEGHKYSMEIAENIRSVLKNNE